MGCRLGRGKAIIGIGSVAKPEFKSHENKLVHCPRFQYLDMLSHTSSGWIDHHQAGG